MSTITNNADFLFLYEATQCNPNGDPDQENKPRMDYDNDINLVTDTRLKRYIRDYLKMKGTEIFVDMENEAKVSPERKLEAVIKRVLANAGLLSELFTENPAMADAFAKISGSVSAPDEIFKKLKAKENRAVSIYLLAQMVKQKFVDIRLFGSAFAVEGFNRAYTGAVQINWGYSLHKVQLMDSSSIVTTMNDDNSTFGKDYRVHYSLLAFNGTINKFAAQSTGLTQDDVETFRDAIWNSIPSLPTRSKLNQYPKLYVEITYNEGYFNGCFGDLRNYVKVEPIEGLDEKQIRSFSDLKLDLTALGSLIQENSGEGKAIKSAFVKTSAGIDLATR
ncbi:MAG: type I-B CRISPR-associated protein Cas7/Csh2 [Dyadobacter sp. 50-39]|uniref:type I-B CRISPR-associated protein Cas7/Csh2 n=1 Tax=Dyadobacter sp. 50-39 TaxID=1895756 RepID=UPI000959FFC2|nr:type I-B CRISPR-associated protein Cas7/Csh2 [Dyadobacter sp. 50-39]OJV22397.1 MAG: type I-B CRISPR-associated protein Cas7/Csh2 [Dyadobacter sp. 50-39]